jgi:O-antigen/teichoic acid export membrane protein
MAASDDPGATPPSAALCSPHPGPSSAGSRSAGGNVAFESSVSAERGVDRSAPVMNSPPRRWLRRRAGVVRLLASASGDADSSTEAQRGTERSRRAAYSAGCSFAARALLVASTLISIPLTLDYLDFERFSVWMVFSSIMTMLSFADLGIGNGMVNAFSRAVARDDRGAAAKCLASGFFLLFGLSALLCIAFGIAYPLTDWAAVFNLKDAEAVDEIRPALLALFAFFVLMLPLVTANKVRFALQEDYVNSAWEVVASGVGLCGLLLVVWMKGGVPWLVLVISAGRIGAGIGNWIHLARSRPWLVPRWRLADLGVMRELLSSGAMFFILSLAANLAVSCDNYIALYELGAKPAATYAVAAKLYGLVTLAASMVLMPLWPAYGEAIARGDLAWLRHTLRRSVLLMATITPMLSALLLLSASAVVEYWTGRDLALPTGLLLAFSLWVPLQSVGMAISVFLNGALLIGPQVLIATSFTVISLAAKVIFAPSFGIAGIVWASAAVYAATTLLPYLWLVPFALRKVCRTPVGPVAIPHEASARV